MSEPNRYTFEAREVLDANGMVCFVGVSTLTHPMGKYVSYEDYARLKAEVERYSNFVETAHVDLNAQNARLKAEVERLELEVFAFDRTIKQASCHYDNRLEDIRQLQAQVKRLTKAGDAMAEIFKNQMDNEPECVGYLQEQLFNRWNAAKEGKQSNG